MADAGDGGNGGAYVWVWTLLGLVAGLLLGALTGDLAPTLAAGGAVGWLAGMSLKDAGTGRDAH